MIDLFLKYLRYERNRSELTVQRYEMSLRDFEAYFQSLEAGLDWASVDADIIRGWMESLMERGNIASTVNTGLSALRSFYRFALARKLVDRDPAHSLTGPKKAKPLPQFVRESEMDKLLDEEQWADDFNNVRARTIIILLYEAGLRRAELIGLNDSDVDFAAGQLKVTGNSSFKPSREWTVKTVTFQTGADTKFVAVGISIWGAEKYKNLPELGKFVLLDKVKVTEKTDLLASAAQKTDNAAAPAEQKKKQ